jgi:Protein of unknown function (DUF3306)
LVSDDLNTRLSRWSQRKLAARRGDVVDEPPDEEAQAPVREQEAAADATDAAPVEDESKPVLPPIEELTAESDYTAFFGKNVSETLKNAALRKLWRSNPIFGHLDGLDDYCEDFNITDTPITLAQTSYKVGKGFLDEIEEQIAKLEPANSDDGDAAAHADSASVSNAPDSKNHADVMSENAAPGDDSAVASRQVHSTDDAAASDGQAEDKAD